MAYNGFESKDAFHAHLQAEWTNIMSTPEGRERHNAVYGLGTQSHAGCDHAYSYCAVI
jgi:hypothetical protein